ncbi:MAG: ABC transporter ATP-binding protein [Peptoniphilus sp.]|nr:ABC transporter ATP-binding protein [Peptoniphilus sp.]MDY3118926.1 ABC transporter ATP-binding protein [Peptoniphilus sp.]
MKAVECKQIAIDYRGNYVLDQLDLTLEPGHIVGLMAPNGAGKTTLLRILAGLEMSYKGSVEIFGKSIGKATKNMVSYQPDHLPLAKDLRAEACVDLYAHFFEDFDRQKAFYMLKTFDLEPNRRIREMSKGMRDKLQVALTLSRKARLYLMDEPIGGVDPLSRKKVIDGILDGFDTEATLIISTHMVEAVEPIIDTAVFLKDGKVLLNEDVEGLRSYYGKDLEAVFREVYDV